MSEHEPQPMKFGGKKVQPMTPEERHELLGHITEARREGRHYVHEELLVRLEATIRARQDDLREQNNRVEGEAIWVERYAEAETISELCQDLARRLRTIVIIGPRENTRPAITLTDHQVAALATWANEGDRKGGTTGFGAYFTAVMEVARVVRDLHEDRITAAVTAERERAAKLAYDSVWDVLFLQAGAKATREICKAVEAAILRVEKNEES